MAMLYFADGGVAFPEDLRRLKKIYDDLCFKHQISPTSGTAEDLAKATMHVFSAGVHDEAAIRERLLRFLRQRPVLN